MMPAPDTSDGASAAADLVCLRCDVPLQVGPVAASYLGQTFPVALPRCPSCGFVYVDEALAGGRMLKVEQALEDK
ncbi:DVU_1557 family redox protein [Azospirillum sp. ST 5-10]|uniref:DVU_1557 family redox protein n=1 Tax=unclassified Azospirillum TaxID=2630922 RepID=UPI003F4A0B20